MNIHWFCESEEAIRRGLGPVLRHITGGRAWPIDVKAGKVELVERPGRAERPVTFEVMSEEKAAEWVEKLLVRAPWPEGADHLVLGATPCLDGQGVRFWAIFVAGEFVAAGLDQGTRMRPVFPPDWLPPHLYVGEWERTAHDRLVLDELSYGPCATPGGSCPVRTS